MAKTFKEMRCIREITLSHNQMNFYNTAMSMARRMKDQSMMDDDIINSLDEWNDEEKEESSLKLVRNHRR